MAAVGMAPGHAPFSARKKNRTKNYYQFQYLYLALSNYHALRHNFCWLYQLVRYENQRFFQAENSQSPVSSQKNSPSDQVFFREIRKREAYHQDFFLSLECLQSENPKSAINLNSCQHWNACFSVWFHP